MGVNRKILIVVGLVSIIPLLVIGYLILRPAGASAVNIGMITALTVIIMVLGFMVLSAISRSLFRLSASIEKIVRGDYTHPPTIDPAGGTTDLALSINQVSQRLRQNLDELQRRAILLERSNQEFRRIHAQQSEDAAHLVHELRAPVINVDKSVQLLFEESPGESQRTYLSIIQTNARRLGRLINDLLDMSKMESGALTLKPAMLVLDDIIVEAVLSMESWIKSKRLVVEKQIPRDMPMVHADKDRIIQVVVNLLSNAVKFTPAEGRIIIKAGSRGFEQEIPSSPAGIGSIFVAVQDSGPGIPAVEQSAIFEKFKTLSDRDNSGVPNTGLGLSIARKIVEMHGGEIWVESRGSGGSTFIFTLPCQDIRGLTQRRILIIDDEESIRELLSRELGKRGYAISVAGNGTEAVTKASNSGYSLVISDLHMPQMNGQECFTVMRQVLPEAKFLFITGFPLDPQFGEIIKQNNYACFEKPFDLEALLKSVDAALI